LRVMHRIRRETGLKPSEALKQYAKIYDGNIQRTANGLGISRSSLRLLIDRFELQPIFNRHVWVGGTGRKKKL